MILLFSDDIPDLARALTLDFSFDRRGPKSIFGVTEGMREESEGSEGKDEEE